MIAFCGTQESEFIVEEVLFSKSLPYQKIIYPNKTDKLCKMLLESDYTHYVIDVTILAEPYEEVIALFEKLKTVSGAKIIFFGIGYQADSSIIKGLRGISFRQFVLAENLSKAKQQFIRCLDGKDTVTELTKVEQLSTPMVKEKEAISPRMMIKTVGVMGSQSRIGTTTQALQFTRYLQYQGYQACYIEAGQQEQIKTILQLYQGCSQDEKNGSIRFEGLDLYYDVHKVQNLLEKGYHVYVYDFGVFEEHKLFSFLEKDLRMVCCGSKPWEMPYNNNLLRRLYQDEVTYLFSFTEKALQEPIRKSMKQKAEDTFFCEYSPAAFTLNSSDSQLHKKLLERLSISPPIQKKGRLFRRKK